MFLFVYFAGGILFLRFKNNATGREMIPNVEFWVSIPTHARVSKIFDSQ